MSPQSSFPIPRNVIVSLGFLVSVLSVFSFNQLDFRSDTLSVTKRSFWGAMVSHDWSVAFDPEDLAIVENTISLGGRSVRFYGFHLNEADPLTNGILFSAFDSRDRETAERRLGELIAKIEKKGGLSKIDFPGVPFFVMGGVFMGLGFLFCKSDASEKDELKALLKKYR